MRAAERIAPKLWDMTHSVRGERQSAAVLRTATFRSDEIYISVKKLPA